MKKRAFRSALDGMAAAFLEQRKRKPQRMHSLDMILVVGREAKLALAVPRLEADADWFAEVLHHISIRIIEVQKIGGGQP